MDELALLNYILDLKKKTNCTKLVGALTIELLRTELSDSGLSVSGRDVFIESVPYEVDLLITKKGAIGEANTVYHPNDVLAVLEIKFRGSYGNESNNHVKTVFDSVRDVNVNIQCFYVALSENQRYKHRATSENLGYECFELLTRDTNLESALKKKTLKATGDFPKLLKTLQKLSN